MMKTKLKSLSRVRLFATPWTVAHQASQSMGFSRQEYWSGVAIAVSRFHRLSLSWASAAQPFAILEYQVLTFCVCVLITQLCLTLRDPTNCSLPGFPGRILQNSSQNSPGKNTGVDCHSLLQRIFLTQGSNPGLLCRRQILYPLSYREVLTF